MPRPLAQQEMHDLLRTATYGDLGCAYHDRVYAVPMAYGFDGRHLYLFTRSGKKTDYLRRNPWVCLTVADVRAPDRWRSVVVDGTIEFLESKEDRALAERSILAHQALSDDSAQQFLSRWGTPESGIFLRIHVRELSGLAENWPAP